MFQIVKDNYKIILVLIIIILGFIYLFKNTYENFSTNKDDLDRMIMNIPDVNKKALNYVFEDLNLKHQNNTLWIEFGVFRGHTINYISSHTSGPVYGFDSFEGLPEKWRDGFEKGAFNNDGNLPAVNENVTLIKGWFNETLDDFLKEHPEPISFIHIDCDLYSSTKYIFDTLSKRIMDGCIIVFDELVNYDGYEKGELKAFSEFVKKNNVSYEWIGMKGKPMNDPGNESVAVRIIKLQGSN
jgi:hypothetical protein